MGRQKKGNPNAQRNNNAKAQGKKNNHPDTEFASYAEVEAEKMSRENKK
ncbi:hypothetical protein [Desertibacillus haloalkaliphilus]|nr:hypothetical protein [Desertibacillus haloalkaliphilus]MBU8907422.1 hypothetical protein [Desertibacillus haloalkaliphilus]